MDRNFVKLLAAEAEEALQAVAKKHGLVLKCDRATYGASSATLKFEFAEVDAAGTVQSKEAEAFKQLAQFHGLQASDLGRTFTSGPKALTITGLRPGASKKPIIVKDVDGKSYVISAEAVAAALKRG